MVSPQPPSSVRVFEKNRFCSAPKLPLASRVAAAGVLALCLVPRAGHACAACYGASDSPMAAGMNWGIMVLLGMIVGVLGGIATCFIVLARRSQRVPRPETEAALLAQAQASWPVVTTKPSVDSDSLTDRGGIKSGTVLMQRRKGCAPGKPVAGRLSPSPRRG
jgi:hypothetical protein